MASAQNRRPIANLCINPFQDLRRGSEEYILHETFTLVVSTLTAPLAKAIPATRRCWSSPPYSTMRAPESPPSMTSGGKVPFKTVSSLVYVRQREPQNPLLRCSAEGRCLQKSMLPGVYCHCFRVCAFWDRHQYIPYPTIRQYAVVKTSRRIISPPFPRK